MFRIRSSRVRWREHRSASKRGDRWPNFLSLVDGSLAVWAKSSVRVFGQTSRPTSRAQSDTGERQKGAHPEGGPAKRGKFQRVKGHKVGRSCLFTQEKKGFKKERNGGVYRGRSFRRWRLTFSFAKVPGKAGGLTKAT